MNYSHFIVVTNRKLCKTDYLMQIRKVTALHPHALILREKDLSDQEYMRLASSVMEICKEGNVLCYLHSRDQIARDVSCQNLHMSISELRRLGDGVKDFNEISVSCHSKEDVLEALAAGASQIVLGTIFETDCKPGLEGRGTSFVSEIAEICPVPLYAIGGIHEDNIHLVMEAGATGGCMMSGFMQM